MVTLLLTIGIVSLITLTILCGIRLRQIHTGAVSVFYTSWKETFPLTSGPIAEFWHHVLTAWHTGKVFVSVTSYRLLVKFAHVAKIKIDAILSGVQQSARVHVADYRAHHAKKEAVQKVAVVEPKAVLESAPIEGEFHL